MDIHSFAPRLTQDAFHPRRLASGDLNWIVLEMAGQIQKENIPKYLSVQTHLKAPESKSAFDSLLGCNAQIMKCCDKQKKELTNINTQTIQDKFYQHRVVSFI